MRIVGIDPGVDGAIVLIVDGIPSKWTVIPTVKEQSGFLHVKGRLKRDNDGNKIAKFRTEIDAVRMVEVFREYAPDYIFLEEVGAMPDQGVVSMFNFGKAFGDVRTAYAWLGCKIERVRPQTWQACLFNKNKGDDSKLLAANFCRETWPNLDFRKSSRARIPHGGTCDAACIAEYGRKTLEGNCQT